MEFLRNFAVDLSKELKEGTENIPKNEPDIKNILNYVYVVMGTVAVVVIVYNAVMYLMSEGDVSRVKRATQALIFAVAGLAVILLAALITNFIFTTIGEA